MSAAERMAHWSFKLTILGLMSALVLAAIIVVLVQVWLIVYYNPWGFSLFPLQTTVLVLVSGIIICFAACGIGILWNSAP